jgi:hypothetical protein
MVIQMENTRSRYGGHGYRKFFTVTDTDTGERFCALCEAFDQSIYKRLRTLIQQDIESNKEIVDDILGLAKKKEEPDKSDSAMTDNEQATQTKGPIIRIIPDRKDETNEKRDAGSGLREGEEVILVE